MRVRSILLPVLVLLPYAGSAQSPPTTIRLVDAVAIFDASADVLGTPDQIVVDRMGTLYVIDYSVQGILRLTPGTWKVDTIGRGGAGPGEFRRPWSIAVVNDTLWTADGALLRVQAFDLGGRYLLQRKLPRADPIPPITLGAGGAVTIGTGGMRGVLAEYFAPGSATGLGIGKAAAPYREVMPLAAIQRDVEAQRIPPYTRNFALSVRSPTGSHWVINQADASVDAFADDGVPQWSRTLEVPAVKRIRRLFFEENRDALRKNVFARLRLVTDAKTVGRSVWILTGGPDDEASRLVVLSPTGETLGMIEIVGVRGARTFAVDVERATLFLVNPGEASLHHVRLEGVPALWLQR